MKSAENTILAKSMENKIVILGLGKSGVSVARFLRAQGQAFIAMDTRTQPPEAKEIAKFIPRDWVSLGECNQAMLNSASTIVLSPGLALTSPYIAEAIEKGVEVIGDIELFVRNADAPIVAITGSNGKTTVTSLLAQMAKDCDVNVKVGGNIGVPALDLLDHSHAEKPVFYILELSSFQLETVQKLNAEIVTVLNISPDHMDRYAGVDEYAAAKYRIYTGEGIAVINKQELAHWGDSYLPVDEQSRRLVSFGLGKPNPKEFGIKGCDAAEYICYGDKNLFTTEDVKLLGTHNLQNILAALTLGKAMALPIDSMVKTIIAYPGLPHRTEWVASHAGVTWINDSKGTNVGATIAALEGLPGDKILIAGGVGKDADFSLLRKAVTQGVSKVVLYGQDATKIENALSGCAEIQLVEGLKAAIQAAKRSALPGNLVLFSPACASFDQFQSYEARGNMFKQLVAELMVC
ncbi:MAG: UDP-N-acetylmuramoyl-L-alanine--D-glutamate ligase [Thiohalomonadales bacterium]